MDKRLRIQLILKRTRTGLTAGTGGLFCSVRRLDNNNNNNIDEKEKEEDKRPRD